MEYNKSEIMKNAWYFFNADKKVKIQNRKTFGECLKAAWALAKSRLEKAAAQASLKATYAAKKFFNGMEITIDCITYTLRRWTNYGKDRVYVSGGINNRMGRSNCYVDLQSNCSTVNNSQLVSIIRSLAY